MSASSFSRLVSTVVACAVLTIACGSALEDGASVPTVRPDSTPVPTTSAGPEPTPEPTPGPVSGPTPPVPDGSIDWGDTGAVVGLGDGWAIAACEGSAPLLCTSRDGRTVGVIEALRFPLASFDGVEPRADDVENLERIAVGFVDALSADRAEGCPAGYVLEAIDPVVVTVAGRTGLHYGFVGTNADGSSSELNLQYATIDGDDLVLFTAIAYDKGGCPGRDDQSGFDSATLAEARPLLGAVLATCPLPPATV